MIIPAFYFSLNFQRRNRNRHAVNQTSILQRVLRRRKCLIDGAVAEKKKFVFSRFNCIVNIADSFAIFKHFWID